MKKRKKRQERRKKEKIIIKNWQIVLVILLILAIVLLVYYKKQILPSPPVVEAPPTMHQFYGTVSYPNGSLINNANVYALVNGSLEANVTSLGGKYGYNPVFTIENVPEGSIIDFYINNVKVASRAFTNLELTEFNLVYDICGDNYCASTRQESCSSCPGDCGECPSGSSPGGGSPGGGRVVPPSVPNLSNRTPTPPTVPGETEETPQTEEKPEKTFNFLIIIIVVAIIILIGLISYLINRGRRKQSNLELLKEKIRKSKTHE